MKLFNMIGTLFENVGYWLLTHGPFAFKVDGVAAATAGHRVAEGEEEDPTIYDPLFRNWPGNIWHSIFDAD